VISLEAVPKESLAQAFEGSGQDAKLAAHSNIVAMTAANSPREL
jgi:hypothetical protein